jgi:hypothetical protein
LHISSAFEAIPELGDTYEARLGSSAFGYNSAKAAMGKPSSTRSGYGIPVVLEKPVGESLIFSQKFPLKLLYF